MRSDVKASTNFPSVEITEEICSLDNEEPDLNIRDTFFFEELCDVFSPEPFLE